MNGFFLLRVGYVIVCWLILLLPITTTNNLATICASLLLFYIPLGFDYWGHEPLLITEEDRKRRKQGVIIPVILSAICIGFIILFSQGFNFIDSKWFSYIKYLLWAISAWFVFLAYQDFVAYSDNEEIQSRQEKRENYRKERTESQVEMSERESYYRKATLKSHVVNTSKRKGRKKRK